MNSVTIIGFICNDVEVKTSAKGTKYVFNSIGFKGTQQTINYMPIKVFGNLAENYFGKYLKKGSQVALSGTIETESIGEGQDKKTRLVIFVNNVQSLNIKKEESGELPPSLD